MRSADLNFAELVLQEVRVMADDTARRAVLDTKAELMRLNDVSQCHIWEMIDFYSRPAAIELCEREAIDLIEDEMLWIEFEDFHTTMPNWVIEDYYERGVIWN